MQFATVQLLDLSLFGNAGEAFTGEPAASRHRVGLLRVGLRGDDPLPSSTKQTTYFHVVGLKVIVSSVWTDTARPFMA